MSLSEKQIGMIKHAYGVESSNPGYRTHYCADLTDYDMTDLVEKGYFREPIGVGNVGEGHGIFHLSDKGVEYAKILTLKENNRTM